MSGTRGDIAEHAPPSSRDDTVDICHMLQMPKTRLDELGSSKPPTSSRDRDIVSTKTRTDELKEEDEVQSNKQLVATSQEFVPQKNEVVVVSSSKLSPTSSSFDYSSVPMPPPLPQHQYQQISHQITDPPIEGDRIHWTVRVSRCGIPDVNGLYNESYNRNGFTSYIKHKIKWQGRTGKCVLDEFYWYIGFQSSSKFVKEGRVERFYRAQVYQYSSFAPPRGSWVTKCPFGVDPPPTLEIGWFDFQTRKYTRYLG